MHRLITLSIFLALTACSKDETPPDNYDPARDYFTFADTDAFTTEHLAPSTKSQNLA